MSRDTEGEPTERVVQQRVRNRIIEYLELASSFESQREYQEVAPVHVPHEVVNQWEDWVRSPDDPLGEPVFSSAERAAVRAFHRVWQSVADSTPRRLPDLEVLFGSPEWQLLRQAAADALAIFAVRGPLSEEDEIE